MNDESKYFRCTQVDEKLKGMFNSAYKRLTKDNGDEMTKDKLKVSFPYDTCSCFQANVLTCCYHVHMTHNDTLICL